ncbi:hypothetical protein KFU94_28445 [Chloroflexi bacterium TSY]|nr:hypothetical protein [Chloroflexi bacterium TSY]
MRSYFPSHIETLHQRFIDSNEETLREIGAEGYEAEGRGVLVVLLRNADSYDKVPVGYASVERLRKVYANYPDKYNVLDNVEQYDPATETLVLFYTSQEIEVFNNIEPEKLRLLDYN